MAAVHTYGNKFTFFYTNKSPFSQFYPAEFEVAGTKYVCAEQYMMHQKAKLFGDHEIAPQILIAEKPMQMKALGRKVKNFNENIWKENRERIVQEGNLAKFSQNDHLKEALFQTKGTLLVEASPRDRIWGIGLGESNPKAMDPKQWRGQNLLGKILTDVRETLMAEEEN